MNKAICTKAFMCGEPHCPHASPHKQTERCNIDECPIHDHRVFCAVPLFYLTEADLGDRIESVIGRELAPLTADEFQSVAEDVYQQLMNAWSEEIDEVIVEALEFIQYAREEE